MKHLRMILSGFAVVALVSGALAFKAYQTPNVFCLPEGTVTGACPTVDLVNFVTDENGFVTQPCTTGVAHITDPGTGNCIDSPITTYTANN